jgi:hypothetical protein
MEIKAIHSAVPLTAGIANSNGASGQEELAKRQARDFHLDIEMAVCRRNLPPQHTSPGRQAIPTRAAEIGRMVVVAMDLLMQTLIHMSRVTAAEVDGVVKEIMALLIRSGVVALTMTIRTLIAHEIIHPGDEAEVQCIETD